MDVCCCRFYCFCGINLAQAPPQALSVTSRLAMACWCPFPVDNVHKCLVSRCLVKAPYLLPFLPPSLRSSWVSLSWRALNHHTHGVQNHNRLKGKKIYSLRFYSLSISLPNIISNHAFKKLQTAPLKLNTHIDNYKHALLYSFPSFLHLLLLLVFIFSFSILFPCPPNQSLLDHPLLPLTLYPRLNNSNHCFNASAITSGRACTSLNTT